MRVIKEGNGENWSLEVKCERVKDSYGLTWDDDKEHCGSLLEITKDDLEYHHWSKYLLNIEGDDFLITCPKCKCRIYIDPDKIPQWVKNYAKKDI